MSKPQTTAVAALLAAFTWAQNANLQIIHNVADVVGVSTPVVLDSIDIYLTTDGGANWILGVPDFKFRQATPYIPLPANSTQIRAAVAPGNSSSVNDTLFSYAIPPLAPNSYNVAVVAGTIDFFTLSVNVDLYYYLNARGTAQNPNQFEFIVFHGAPNVGTVGVYLAWDRTTSAYQADFTLPQYQYHTSYLGLSLDNFVVLDTTPANPNDILPTGYYVPDPSSLNLLGQTGVVFASGYADTTNPNIAFGLYVALSNGNVVPLPSEEVRRIQIVHNAADPALAQVDIHQGSVGPDPLQLDFRQATPTMFVEGPTGNTATLVFTARGGTTPIATVPLALPAAGGNYVVFAQGVANPAQFAANPDNVSTAFGLVSFPVEGWAPSGSFKAIPFHGVTDAPTVDLYAGSTPIAMNLAYKSYASSVTLPAGSSATIDVRPANQTTVLASFPLADTQTRDGEGTVIFASGFLNPPNNQNGPAFGLYIVYPNGEIQPLSSTTGIANPSPVRGLSVAENPNTNGTWTVYLTTDRVGEVPYSLITPTGQVLRQGTWSVPGNGTWGYALSGEELPAGLYLLRIGDTTLRLVRL